MKRTGSKFVYIIGSAVIGVIAIISVLLGLFLSGAIDARSVKLVFETSSAENVYDGTELTCDEWKLLDGELKDGHTAEVLVTGKQRDVGSSENTFSVVIKDKNDADVTSDYEIEKKCGSLTVAARPITLTASSASKVYDGTPLTEDFYTVSEGALLETHTIEVVTRGEIIDAGEADNNIQTVQIFDENGKEITFNYAVTTFSGKLLVEKRPIAVSSGSYEKVYDGLPLVGDVEDCEMVSIEQLLDGHTWEATLCGTQTEAGSSSNKIADVVIMNGEENVTRNYEISYKEGTLKVKPRAISLLSGSASKAYDGTPLTYDYYELTSINQLLDGHSIEVVVSGTRTEVGSSENIITDVQITSGDDRDVTSNYAISCYYGELIVIGATSGDAIGGDESGKGGNMSGASGEGGAGGSLGSGSGEVDLEKVVAKIYAEYKETFYLRSHSYGEYTGQGFSPAVEYGEYLDAPYGMSYLTGLTVKGNGGTTRRLRVEVLESAIGYILPYYLSMDDLYYAIQGAESYNAGSVDFEYSMYYYPYSYQQNGALSSVRLGEYAEAEEAYRNFVYENYLSLPSTLGTRSYMQQLIKQQSWSATDVNIIKKVASFIQNSATYNMEYDTAMDRETDVVVAFLSRYKEGVCRHYAAAATALFRTLGIPARYTVGYCVDAKANDYTDVKVKNGHAWVEVYLNGIGWVHVEVTGGGNGNGSNGGGNTGGGSNGGNMGGGGGDIEENKSYIATAKSLDKIYDGTPLYAVNEVILNKDLKALIKAKKYTYQVVVSGSRTEVGKSSCSIQKFILLDADGNDVTYKYNVTKKPGMLQVYRYEAKIVTLGATKVYDGTPLTSSLYETIDFRPGHTVSMNFTGTQTNAGSSYNLGKAKVTDARGKDISEEYKITYSYGKLIVTPRYIKIQSGSMTQTYNKDNPTTLTCYDCKLVDSFTVENHSLQVSYTGSQTYIGESDNTFTIKIYDENGQDVTRNYSIDYIYGKLSVLP